MVPIPAAFGRNGARMSGMSAPAHLSPSSKRLYRQLVADYALDREPAAIETLRLACEALDRAAEARRELAENGAVYIDRFNQPKTSPWVAIERDSRIAAVRCFRELSLDGGSGDYTDARPPRIGSGALS
jgi:phage terminase small subunit